MVCKHIYGRKQVSQSPENQLVILKGVTTHRLGTTALDKWNVSDADYL